MMLFRRGGRADPAPEARAASALPGFASNATDDLVEGPAGRSRARTRLAIAEALGASQPVTQPELFAGRRRALSDLIAAVEQQRAHVVLYGERGIGKTSLLHVFAESARGARYQVHYGSCGVEARFDEMFRAFAARVPLLFHRGVSPTADEAEHQQSFASLLPPGPFGPRELADLFADVVGTRVLLLLDEYDRVADPAFRRDVAELIKNLSDRAARVQLVLAGVASNLDELIGFSPSIRRNIVGLGVGPMAADEVRAILAAGEAAAGIRFAEDAAATIATMAGGSPYLARLLASRAAGGALDRGGAPDRGGAEVVVARDDVLRAAEASLAEWNGGLPRRVQGLLTRPEVRAAWPLLIAAARASGTPDGWFAAEDAAAELGDARPPRDVARDLARFTAEVDLFDAREDAGVQRFRFRQQGVAQLLNLSAALARLEG